MSPIQIRSATSSDASAISQVHFKAQGPWNDFYAAMFTEHPRDFLMPLTTLALTHTDSSFLVATYTTSRHVLGFIRYNIIDPSSTPDVKKKSDGQILLEAHLPKPKTHLREIWNRFEDRREEEKEACYCNIHQGRRHTYVNHLMIDPEFQRQGIGRLLLDSVIKLSDRERIPTILCSSREARTLYSHMKFESIQSWDIDTEYWAREIESHEHRLGMNDQKVLAATYKRCSEEEVYMVRWPANVAAAK